MPWLIRKRDDEYCVFKHDVSGDPEGPALGCHPSRAKADAQLKALYSSAVGELADRARAITAGGWDEESHPRDTHGRFGSGDGGSSASSDAAAAAVAAAPAPHDATTDSINATLFKDQTFGSGDFTVEGSVYTDTAGRTTIDAAVMHDGKNVGFASRIFSTDKNGDLVVTHDEMKLRDSARGQGFATDFNRHMESYYRANGVKEINLTASGTDGWRVWANAGFDWSSKQSQTGVTDALRRGGMAEPDKKPQLDALRDRVVKTWGTPDAPTPKEIHDVTPQGLPRTWEATRRLV